MQSTAAEVDFGHDDMHMVTNPDGNYPRMLWVTTEEHVVLRAYVATREEFAVWAWRLPRITIGVLVLLCGVYAKGILSLDMAIMVATVLVAVCAFIGAYHHEKHKLAERAWRRLY